MTEPGRCGWPKERKTMSDNRHVARASTVIDAPREEVWEALVDPEIISRYMFGTRVATDWQEGSPITWEGEWEGQKYEDKGTVIEVEPLRALEFSHFSPLTGLPDVPANYHDVRIEIEDDGSATTVSLTQDNNETAEERKHSEGNWQTMLDSLKKVVEEGSA